MTPPASAPRRVLIASYYAPPSRSTGARRAGNLAAALHKLGASVTVMTSASAVGGQPAPSGTVATSDLMTTRLNWRREQLDALLHTTADATYSARTSRVADLIAPDPQALTWLPFAARELDRLLSADQYDCVITTSPPQSAHLLGSVARRHRTPWIADLRDGWQFERLAPSSPIRPIAAADRLLERRTLARASVLTTVTDAIGADLKRRFNRPVRVITNGFDPKERNTHPYRRRSSTLELAFTGALTTGARGEDLLTPLLAGIRLACDRTPPATAYLTAAGPITLEEKAAFSAHADVARHVGLLPRDAVLELQRTADVLIVPIGDRKPGVATGKVYEYLAANRPILVIGEDSAAAGIVTVCRAGVACANNPASIAAALATLDGSASFAPSTHDVDQFSWDRLGQRFAEAIEEAIDEGTP